MNEKTVIGPEDQQGKPVIRGTGLTVSLIVGRFSRGRDLGVPLQGRVK
jgi:uncharacterized protein (DUF433 family)